MATACQCTLVANVQYLSAEHSGVCPNLYAWQAMHQGRGAGVGRGEDGGGTGVM